MRAVRKLTRLPPTQLLFRMVMTIWLIGLINAFLDYHLNFLGIYPRKILSLPGIVFAPLLHGSFMHLLGNTMGFFALGWLVSLYNRPNKSVLLELTVVTALLGGLLTWIFGRPSTHIGLSGVIFGYWGFIIINGYFERSFKSIFLSLIAVMFYGGMIFGLLPTSPHISFEGHLFGAISGVMYSYLHRHKANT